MNYGNIAALIRGLCIDLTGRPQIVVCETAKQEKIPARALCMEIGSAENEESAAEIIRKAYAAWKAGNSAGDGKVPLPSCAALCANGKAEALFWIDNDFDSARQRLAAQNDTPRVELAAAVGAVVDAAQRAAVVKNRIALVTGGAQGIGEEIVRNLAAAGALVFIADLNLEGAKKLAEEINAAENRTAALAVQVNVGDEGSVQAMFNTIAESAGGLDLCISNAGVLKAGSVLEQDLADFKFVTEINYTAFFFFF
jgi:sorbitol-6-phosphate 2-dehydrogenase